MILHIISLLFLALGVSNLHGANQQMPDIQLVGRFSDTEQVDNWLSQLSTLELNYSTLELSLLIPEPDSIFGERFIDSNHRIDIPILPISALKLLDGVRLDEDSLNKLPNFPNLREIVFLPTCHASILDLEKICNCNKLESLKIKVHSYGFKDIFPAFPPKLKELEISIDEKWEKNIVSAASGLLHLETVSFGNLNYSSIEALSEKIEFFKNLKILKFKSTHQWDTEKIKRIINLSKKFGGYINMRFFINTSGNFNFEARRNPDNKDGTTAINIYMTDVTSLEKIRAILKEQEITDYTFHHIE